MMHFRARGRAEPDSPAISGRGPRPRRHAAQTMLGSGAGPLWWESLLWVRMLTRVGSFGTCRQSRKIMMGNGAGFILWEFDYNFTNYNFRKTLVV